MVDDSIFVNQKDEYLSHIGRSVLDGAPIGSGRWPLGSGENPNQRPKTFLARIEKLEEEGLSEKDIAQGFGMSVRQLRSEKTLALHEVRTSKMNEVIRLHDQEGLGWTEIANKMGLANESSARSLYNQDIAKRQNLTQATADVLKSNVDKQKYTMIGEGVASGLGIADTRLDAAVRALQKEGYHVYTDRVEQVSNPGKQTTIKVLAKPDVTWRDFHENRADVGLLNEKFVDPHSSKLAKTVDPKSISSDRIQVVGKESGGANKDGVIELRRGVDGLSLGDARYAQVRIAVDGTHYLKGMAIYGDDLPKGIDIRLNSNKSDSLSKKEHFKKMKDDKDNPFGATIKENGQRGYLNIVGEEGDWDAWSRTLSSQVLSKQSIQLAKRQLSLSRQDKMQELSEIESLTNPTLKKHMLQQFADNCDSAAVHLKAAALPGQSSHVILPLTTIKENEVYAPSYPEGSTVVLIRHPHGGTFEIPELKVNKRNKEAKRLFENATDAIGIHPKVAARLSGADFDGDTVLVIPNDRKSIRTTPAIKDLQEFDSKSYYDPEYAKDKSKGGKKISSGDLQKKMGEVSNLITDMTIQNAPVEEITRAVKHSMVIIDAEKHGLNYKKSARDQGIEELRKKYQQRDDGKAGGASTLISRAKSEERVALRSEISPDPKTGEKRYRTSKYAEYIDAQGKTKYRTSKSTKMAEASDARSLISSKRTNIEIVYADHANQLKTLANKARKEALSIKEPRRSSEAASVYSKEVASLEQKRSDVRRHTPYERKAQLVADQIVSAKIASNPAMTPDQKKKVRNQAISDARARFSPEGRPKVVISDKEWTAIQSGAVSKSLLEDIFKYADQDALKQRAMPKSSKGLTNAKLALAKSRLSVGYSIGEVAKSLGVSASSLKKALYSQS